jgi:sec-independent protein translocase protein TatB
LMYEFRKASNDFKFQMEEELRLSEEADRRKREEAERQRVAALAPPVTTPVQTIEAQADIGAIESPTAVAEPAEPTVSYDSMSLETTPSQEADPGEAAAAEASPAGASSAVESPYPGEGQYPEPDFVETQPALVIPRIQPPSTGEQVSAARPGRIEPVPAGAESPVSESQAGTQPTQPAELPDIETPNPPSEPVSQHG